MLSSIDYTIAIIILKTIEYTVVKIDIVNKLMFSSRT